MFRTKVLIEKNVMLQKINLRRVAHFNAKHFRRKLQRINSTLKRKSNFGEDNLKQFQSNSCAKGIATTMKSPDSLKFPYSVLKTDNLRHNVPAGTNVVVEDEGNRSCHLVLKMYCRDRDKFLQQVSDIARNMRMTMIPDLSTNVSFLSNIKPSSFHRVTRNFSTQADKVKDSTETKLLERNILACDKETDDQEKTSQKILIDCGNESSKSSQPATHPFKANHVSLKRSPILPTVSAPKNVLHNIFQIISKELKSDLRLNPQYKLSQNKGITKWLCTYNLKWPELASFTATSGTKQDASKKAAMAALSWLKSINKIDNVGHPIIYDKSVTKELKKSNLTTIKCDEELVGKMKAIITEFRDQMFPHIIQTESNDKGNNVGTELISEDDVLRLRDTRLKYLGLHTYVAKEPNKLPISDSKNEFIDLLKHNRVVIIKGEPGCGKSTRVPQYVLEHWAKETGSSDEFCRIAVTQPRRIAAISLADRVAHERGESTGDIVGYHVRLKSSFSQRTGRILYCTTGILLRHLQTDLSLKGFTYVLLDEAHERDINTDLLMNLLKKSLTLNPNLKLIIMSATIDTDIFKNYFDGAPVMVIPGFTYPVKSFYLDTCHCLDLSKTLKMCQSPNPHVVHDDVVRVIKHIHEKKSEGAILVFLPGWDDISKVKYSLSGSPNMSVLCLHSRLQDSDQYRIFSKPPPGIRKVILATNIAETSVTIDDVVYVVETGIHKESRFDIDRGVMCIDNHWISQASMTQRKGRAGRVQPGECFHLYPKAQAEAFEEFTVPEILKTSLTKVILDCKVITNNMKALDIMHQLLSPPDEAAVMQAVDELKELELLDADENLTPLGTTLADFQLEPKLSKAMVNSVIFKCVTPVVDITTLFSAETEFFTHGLVDKDMVKTVKRKFAPASDHLALMRLFEKWVASSDRTSNDSDRFCSDTGLVSHKMALIAKLRNIHFDYLYKGLYDVLPISDDYSDNDELVKAVILCGVGNFLQHRNWDIVKGRYKTANIFLTRRGHKATLSQESVNCKRSKFPSDFFIYINETRSNLRRITVIRESSIISPLTLLLFSSKNISVTEENMEDNPEMVQLSLMGTNVKVLCNRQEAKVIVDCKEALFAGYKFYINLLTQGGHYNPKVNESWNKIISSVSDLLTKAQVK